MIYLHRGIFQNDTLLQNFITLLNDKEVNVLNISLLDENGAPVLTWQAANAQIIRIVFADLESQVNEVAEYVLEVSYESISITSM